MSDFTERSYLKFPEPEIKRYPLQVSLPLTLTCSGFLWWAAISMFSHIRHMISG